MVDERTPKPGSDALDLATSTRPPASSAHVRMRMQAQRRFDTGVELDLRRELWRRGLRYRLQQSVIDRRRRHDLVFTNARVVVEVRGCFWHSCPDHGSLPKSNRGWWRQKLRANRVRDEDTARRLHEAGWLLIVVWEHDDPRDAANVIERTVRERQRQSRACATRKKPSPQQTLR